MWSDSVLYIVRSALEVLVHQPGAYETELRSEGVCAPGFQLLPRSQISVRASAVAGQLGVICESAPIVPDTGLKICLRQDPRVVKGKPLVEKSSTRYPGEELASR